MCSSGYFYTPEKGYIPIDSEEKMPFGVGAVVQCDAGTTTVTGQVAPPYMEVDAGWNLIGAPEDTVAVDAITTSPRGILDSDFLTRGQEGELRPVTELRPGSGYWIDISKAGRLDMSGTSVVTFASMSSVASAPDATSSKETLEDASRLVLVDAKGRESTLWLKENLSQKQRARFALPPRPPGYPSNRELFEGRTGLTFDPYAPGEVAATMVLEALTHPERAMRLVVQHDADADRPGLSAVLTRITDRVWKSDVPADAHRAETQRTTQQVWTDVLLSRAAHADTAPAVRARLAQHARDLAAWLADHPGTDAETQAHRRALRAMIERFLERDHEGTTSPASLETPPGSPIGQGAPAYVQRQQHRHEWLAEQAPALPACFQ